MNESKQLIFIIGARNKSNLFLKYLLINEGYKVLLIEEGINIQKYVEEEVPALLLSEFDGLEGYTTDLLKEIKSTNITKLIPFVFIMKNTERSIVPELYELGADYIIFKPISRENTLSDIKGILIKSQKNQRSLLTRGGISGDLKDMSVIEIIQTLDMNEKTGILKISHGEDNGYVYFNRGKMVKAKALNLKDEPAIFRILQWREGTFIFENKIYSKEKSVHMPDQRIVLEGLQRIDEMNKLVNELGSLDSIPVAKTIRDTHVFMDLSMDEKSIYLRLDGKNTLHHYIRYNAIGDLELIRLFFALHRKGIVGFKKRQQSGKPVAAVPPNKKRMSDIFKNVENILFKE